MRSKRWWWVLALLPVFGAPLIAQEPAVEDTAEKNQNQTPAPPVATPAEESPEQASQEDPRPAEERISADNNLSFPVDI